MLADCADPCIRGRISKLLASAVAAANLQRTSCSPSNNRVWRPTNQHARSCYNGERKSACSNRWQAATGEWCRLAPDGIMALRALDAKKSPDIEPGLEWRKRNSRTSRSRLALSDLVSHPFCLRELMGTTNSSHPLCPSLNPLKAATSFAKQRHLKCRRCPTAERSLT